MTKKGEKKNPMNCTICQKTNHIPNGQLLIVVTFAQQYFAKNVLLEIEKAHITFVDAKILSADITTLCIELHGIKDIIQLQALYIESMCRDNNALTFDIISSQKSYQKILQQLQ